MSKPSIGSQLNPIDHLYVRHLHTVVDTIAVGIILPFAGNGAIPNGYLLCDGSAVNRGMYPDLFTAIGTTYGSGDGSTTFNLPDSNQAKRFLQGDTVAGTVKQAGLPNITGKEVADGSFGLYATGDRIMTGFVAQKKGTASIISSNIITTNNGGREITYDASRCSTIYGNSTTVQPPALTTRYIIKAFDGQTSDSALIDITQYAQDLAHKANIDGSNMVHHKDVITTSGTYTAPATGLYKITVKGGGGGGCGSGNSGANSCGGGGGGEGGTTIEYTKMNAGDTAVVVIGAGGTGGDGDGVGGSDGGDSSVTINSNVYTAGGGKKATSRQTPGAGGSGTIIGCSGGGSIIGAESFGFGGVGGGNGGGHSRLNSVGADGVQGGGGAGGSGYQGTNHLGGAGGDGYVWFEYFATA